jgi:hypothetical protein
MASQAGTKKEISSHGARHTFTSFRITIGIPIEVISKFLGHSSLSIAHFYAKTIAEVKVREMKMFDPINPGFASPDFRINEDSFPGGQDDPDFQRPPSNPPTIK